MKKVKALYHLDLEVVSITHNDLGMENKLNGIEMKKFETKEEDE